ncbi:MAG TPA: hypothetical protein VHL11_02655, partial [Phototrophicaceae bacterium]|nr:hypothetical protein [Phototrophicaceae bacterium]
TDGTQIEIQFGVTNIGGPSTIATQAELIAFDGGTEPRVVAITSLRPLAGNNDREILTLTAAASQFPPGSQQVFRIQIASLPGQPAITSDTLNISIEIPLTAGAATSIPVIVQPGVGQLPLVVIPGLGITIDLNNREQLLEVAGIVAAGLLILILFSLLLRLIFRRTPDFKSVWQPPYATVPPLDPYSTAGIRQSWQPLAQNNLITSPSTPGIHQAVKLLLGTNGHYLSGWTIVAIRLIQYDQFGRVSRTETLATSRMIRQINRLADKSGRFPYDRLVRMVKPTARKLAKLFGKKVTARSAMLPIALDIRFRGIHGEVNIVFELHRFETGYWQPVDRWQPEMMIAGKTLLESYTYSLFGQSGGETLRQFRRRLPDDLARILADMIGARPPEVPSMIVSPAQSTGINPSVQTPE